MATVSPRWSPWPWVRRIASAGAQALLDVRPARRLEDLLVVHGAEPVRLVQRGVEDALERRRVLGDDPLRLVEPGRIRERLHGGVDLGIGIGAAGGHRRAIIRAWLR